MPYQNKPPVGSRVSRTRQAIWLDGWTYYGVSLMNAKMPSRFILVFHDTNVDAGTYDSRFLCAVGDGRIPTRIEEMTLMQIVHGNYRTVPRDDLQYVLSRIPLLEEWLTRWLKYDRPTRSHD